MSMLETKDLHKTFGKNEALAGVDLRVEAGEIYGFIGPNGAGKSTTIRVLLGILKATSGSASIFGLDPWKDAVEIHKRIAYVPGDVNLWANLTGGEVVDLFVRMKKGRDKSYKEELIERFDFDPKKQCGADSKGTRQKVALVSAFSSDADLYILDEPTSGLDPLMELVFKECVETVKAEGKSVFLSSHILSEVEQLCDKVSIIRRGKIIDGGTLTELRHLTRNNVTVETATPPEGLETMNGVYDVKTGNGVTEFRLDNRETEPVMKYLSSIGIKRLISTPPTLEELFMSHYDKETR
jgi:ABC-2 type transport system ATP-binding protein